MKDEEKQKVIDAILDIDGSAEVTIGDTMDDITWHKGTAIEKDIISKKMEELVVVDKYKQFQFEREDGYPNLQEFAEAYCEKEILGDSTKWDAYVVAYKKVRQDIPKG